ncbi:toll/interleukin-1 receptor domain-containing protein [Rhodoblastus sp.]|uniref:toll/interleukin-1 receptor domain-containing protein n=1 Tax=Rhodoblastus sp. TaxID=1962975 RepID=UPI003F9BFAAC
MARDVFISYEKGDLATAEAIARKLEKSGVSVWYAPRDLLPGENWVDALPRALGGCRLVVLIYSPRSDGSEFVVREVNYATTFKKPIIPFCLSPINKSSGLGFIVSTSQWLDAYPPPLGPHFDKLIATVRVRLAQRPASAPAAGAKGAPAARQTVALMSDVRSSGPRAIAEVKKMTPVVVALALVLVVAVVGLTAIFAGGSNNTGGSGSNSTNDANQAASNSGDCPAAQALLAQNNGEDGSALPGHTDIPGKPEIICMNTLAIGHRVIRLAGVGAERVHETGRLATWIEENGGTVDCTPVDYPPGQYRCYVGNADQSDVATHILQKQWARPAN